MSYALCVSMQELPSKRPNATFKFLPGKRLLAFALPHIHATFTHPKPQTIAAATGKAIVCRDWSKRLQGSNSVTRVSVCACAGVGHCLHDDRPEVVHGELLPWLETLHLESSNSCASENNVGESKSVSERESVRTSVRESSLELPDFPTAPPSTTKELRKTPADKTTVRV